ncbi:type II CAAX prenyl endopeptidase Rce1 family protein [Novosphingobium sp.]|uniref:CPBP family glutamic-type intramembrane protease n=1 Tax=Novosphingobium sp. TaxID=1874826 RepID=UPI002B482D83|nr:CPBP family glutamic-type intramembrane protease [Novosphingobium sp.]HKR93433.1 CPBP family glutamic-type intramembrane protease [Novosphingobium sp.]
MMEARDWQLPAGLHLTPRDPAQAVRATATAAIAACALMILADFAFRNALPREYLDHYTAPLWPRTLLACIGALREELIYRLALLTALAALPALFGRKAGHGWMIAAIAAAQLANIGALAFILPPYGMLRFWLVGCIWGWLYWRHGFASALAGHGLSHLLLDPVLQMVLSGF